MNKGNSNENPEELKIVFGPVIPVVEKTEICKIPSEKAGEKKVVSREQLKVPTMEIPTVPHVLHVAEKEIIKRVSKDGKVLTENKGKKEVLEK